ncbi:MAG: hypothetical protein HYS41_04725 [Candidatus Omnitrophica bacterium]|nr:hypothetical protein [Candidatus Omnitrophota bacterium]
MPSRRIFRRQGAAVFTLLAFVSLELAGPAGGLAFDNLRQAAIGENRSGLEELGEKLQGVPEGELFPARTKRLLPVVLAVFFGFAPSLPNEEAKPPPSAPTSGPVGPAGERAAPLPQRELALINLEPGYSLEDFGANLEAIALQVPPKERTLVFLLPRPWTLRDVWWFLQSDKEDPDYHTLYPLLYRRDPKLFKDTESREALLRLVARMQSANSETLADLWRSNPEWMARLGLRIHRPDSETAARFLEAEFLLQSAFNTLFLETDEGGRPAAGRIDEFLGRLQEAVSLRARRPNLSEVGAREINALMSEKETTQKYQAVSVLMDEAFGDVMPFLEERPAALPPLRDQELAGRLERIPANESLPKELRLELLSYLLEGALLDRGELKQGYSSFAREKENAPPFEKWIHEILTSLSEEKLIDFIGQVGEDWREYLGRFENTLYGPDEEDAREVFSDFVRRRLKQNQKKWLPRAMLQRFEELLDHLEKLRKLKQGPGNPDDDGKEAYSYLDATRRPAPRRLARDTSRQTRSRAAGLEEPELIVAHPNEVNGLGVIDRVWLGETKIQEEVLREVLSHLSQFDPSIDPLNSLVLNVASGPFRLKLKEGPPEDQNLINMDPNYPKGFTQSKGARLLGESTSSAIEKGTFRSKSSLPKIVLLYHPEAMRDYLGGDEKVQAFLKQVWSLTAEGGWILFIESRSPGREYGKRLDYFYHLLLKGISSQKPARLFVVSDSKVGNQKLELYEVLRRPLVVALQKPAGLEEGRRTLGILGEAAQGPGVVVVDKALLPGSWLAEFLKRAPDPLAGRVVAGGLEELDEVVVTLMGMPQAERIGVVGDPKMAEGLSRLLPDSMDVILLGTHVGLEEISRFLRVPEAVLDQVDAAGLEEDLAAQRGA